MTFFAGVIAYASDSTRLLLIGGGDTVPPRYRRTSWLSVSSCILHDH